MTLLDQTLSHRDELSLRNPFAEHLGLVFDGRAGETAHAHFLVERRHEGIGSAHAGALYALLDVTSYLALAPALSADQHAVTCDLHVSVMRPLRIGERCDLVGRVVRRGRTLAFLEARAEVDGHPIAIAHVTKAMLAAPPTTIKLE